MWGRWVREAIRKCFLTSRFQAQLLRFGGRGGAAGAWLRLPSLIEINYSIRGLRHGEQPTSGLMRDPGGLDVTGLGEAGCVIVQRRDQRAPRKGTKGS